MRRQLLSSLAVLALATSAIAQGTTTGDDAATTTAVQTTGGTTATTAATETTDAETDATTEATSEATSDATSDATTTDDDATSTTAQTSRATTTTAPTTTETAPALTTSTTATTAAATDDDDGDTPPPLSTNAGQYSYAAPTVPPTNNAPYMQPMTVPEGTFFIAVGAVLGAFGVAILIWRAVVACLLHRNVKRAALAQQMATDKPSFAPPAAPFYKYSDRGSDPSIVNAGTAGRGVRRTQRGPTPSATPSQTNLFFSPTAAGANTAGNRESRFLPSGFYSAGSAAALQQGGHGHSISLTNLRPDSRGHARVAAPSPDESPSLAPRHADPTRRNMSTSTLNLNRPPSQRAPSAFLEDLLADNPDQFPPQGQTPGQQPQHGWSQSQNRI